MKFKLTNLIPLSAMAVGIIPTISLTSCNSEKMKVIVDTDVGNDCDDIAALTILGNAYKRNMVDVLAVTVCNKDKAAIHATDIMLERYGIDCPIGDADNNQPVINDEYAREIDNRWIARCEIDKSRIQSATHVLRKTLAENNGKKIKLITLGMFNNIASLINSQGDEISPKTGKQLLEENVSEIVSMGGNFHDQKSAEFNITQALPEAQTVINGTTVPMTFLDWQVGEIVKSGKTFYQNPGSPQCVAYATYTHGELRQSWDPLTMYVAINGAWAYSNKGNVKVDDQGHTIFTETNDGLCRYIPVHPSSEQIANILETWYTVV